MKRNILPFVCAIAMAFALPSALHAQAIIGLAYNGEDGKKSFLGHKEWISPTCASIGYTKVRETEKKMQAQFLKAHPDSQFESRIAYDCGYIVIVASTIPLKDEDAQKRSKIKGLGVGFGPDFETAKEDALDDLSGNCWDWDEEVHGYKVVLKKKKPRK